jgi:hypothetical protein
MSYRVFQIFNIGAPRDHYIIFVETNKSAHQWEYLYQIASDVQNAIEHKHKPAKKREESASFTSNESLGTVTVAPTIPK